MQTESHASRPGADAYEGRPWLAQYPHDVPTRLTYPSQTIWELVEETTARHPDKPAFVFQDRVISFKQVRDHALRLSESLAAAGVKKGDVVLVLLPNTPHFPVAYYATARLGAALAAAPPNSVERDRPKP